MSKFIHRIVVLYRTILSFRKILAALESYDRALGQAKKTPRNMDDGWIVSADVRQEAVNKSSEIWQYIHLGWKK